MKKYAYLHTAIGLLELEEMDEKLVALNFVKYHQHPQTSSLLLQEAKWQLEAYFEGKRKYFDLPLSFETSSLYKKIYSALIGVSYATTIEKNQLSKLISKKDITKEIDEALKDNPFPIIVPSHRVLDDNSLDLKAKRWLLEHEKGILT